MDDANSAGTVGFGFLDEETVQKAFADINLNLLLGKHIDATDVRCFPVLEEFPKEFKSFYEALYRLRLERRIQDGDVYYYLDFPDGSKGRLSHPSRHRPLSAPQTIVGLALINMYESKLFQQTKRVSWGDIQHEMTDGAHREEYRRIFLRDKKGGWTEKLWDAVRRSWLSALKRFDHLGWINLHAADEEDFWLEIKPSIHRLASLYSQELAEFSEFSSRVLFNNEEE